MLKALSSLSQNPLGASDNPRVQFYDRFQQEADDYDSDFLKKYGGDLDTTLIFVGIFSIYVSYSVHLVF